MRISRFTVLYLFLLTFGASVLTAQPYGEVVTGGDSTFTTSGVVLRSFSGRPYLSAQTATTDANSAFVIFNSASTELLKVRSDGRIGVGTSNPRTMFHLARNASGIGPELTLENNTGTIDDASAITFASAGATRAQIVSALDASSANGNFAFKTGISGATLVTRMSISAGGDVAITGSGMPLKLTGATGTIMFKDTQNWFGIANGIRMEMGGNSDITVAGMQIGSSGASVIKSSTASIVMNSGSTVRVEDLNRDAELIVSAGDNPGDANFPQLTLVRKDGNDVQVAKYGLRLDTADGKLKMLHAGSGSADYNVADPLLTVDSTGNLVVKGSVTGATVFNAVYQDVAEWVPAALDMAPGTVVILDPEKVNQVMPSTRAYDASVAGVVSAQPGVLLGVGGADREMVATTGRVRVKVDAAAAPIRIGDLLVTSNKSGYAMKSIPVDVNGMAMHRPGTIVGKALEPLASGEGEILVLLSLQ